MDERHINDKIAEWVGAYLTRVPMGAAYLTRFPHLGHFPYLKRLSYTRCFTLK